MKHYPHHIGDFDKATRHLSRLERSIYRDLIDLYYDTEKPLSLNKEALCRRIIARSDEESTAVEQVLTEFFTETPAGWYHERCEEELDAYRANTSQKAMAGKASAAAKQHKKQQALNGKSTAVEQPLKSVATAGNGASTNHQPSTINHQPIDTPIPPEGACDQESPSEAIDETPTRKPRKQAEPVALPDWIPAETWAAFLETRKKKKAANTDFALGLVIKTLAKFRDAGHDPIEALENSIKGGWSDVYEPKPRTTAAINRPQLSYSERDRIAGMQQWEAQCNQRHPDLEAEYSLLVNTGNVIDAANSHMRISK
jgi:uncharacterized protein YdaU (DUF1376 family)